MPGASAVIVIALSFLEHHIYAFGETHLSRDSESSVIMLEIFRGDASDLETRQHTRIALDLCVCDAVQIE